MADSNDWRACASCMSSFCVCRRSCSSSTMRSMAVSMMSFSLFLVMVVEDEPRSTEMGSVGFGSFSSSTSMG